MSENNNPLFDLEEEFPLSEEASVEELLTDTALTANAIVQLLVEKKVITVEEFDDKIDQLLSELEGYEDEEPEVEDDEAGEVDQTVNH